MLYSLSPDLQWVLESVNSGFINDNHPYLFNKLLALIKSVRVYFYLNSILIVMYLIYFYKKFKLFLVIPIVIFLFATSSITYIQKDIFFLWMFGVTFCYLAYPEHSLGEILLISISIFFGAIAFIPYALLCLILIFLKNKNVFKAVIINNIILILLLCAISPQIIEKNQNNYKINKLILTYISDLVYISEINSIELSIPHQLLTDVNTWDCIRNSRKLNIINPEGVANIDPIVTNGCIIVNNTKEKLSFDEILLMEIRLFANYPRDFAKIKFLRFYQLIIKPGKWFFVKILIGPAIFVLLTIFFILTKESFFIRLCAPVWIHLFFIAFFAPGYDLRYTYPEFMISLILTVAYLKKNKKFQK